MSTSDNRSSKILIIRRDNIGDLLCTTPLLTTLRHAWPEAWIGVLANRYNAPILAGNPDIDDIFAYEKAKHRAGDKRRLTVWRETAMLLWRLRRMRLDIVLCASPGARRFARLLAPRRIIEADRSGSEHEVAITARLLQPLGVTPAPGPLVLHADAMRQASMRAALDLPKCSERCLSVHISARKPKQRWPIERHAELIRRILAAGLANRILLFWAPGSADDPLHPGDDDKAEHLINLLGGLPVNPVATRELPELVAGLSLADVVVCSDGGAMHIAAALGKPILCFFGNSAADRWHPWGVPYELLQPASHDVADIGIDEAYSAFNRLMGRIGPSL